VFLLYLRAPVGNVEKHVNLYFNSEGREIVEVYEEEIFPCGRHLLNFFFHLFDKFVDVFNGGVVFYKNMCFETTIFSTSQIVNIVIG